MKPIQTVVRIINSPIILVLLAVGIPIAASCHFLRSHQIAVDVSATVTHPLADAVFRRQVLSEVEVRGLTYLDNWRDTPKVVGTLHNVSKQAVVPEKILVYAYDSSNVLQNADFAHLFIDRPLLPGEELPFSAELFLPEHVARRPTSVLLKGEVVSAEIFTNE